MIELHVREFSDTMATMSELAKLSALSIEETSQAVSELERQGLVCVFPMKRETFVWHMADEASLRGRLVNALQDYVRKYPYRYGMPKAEVHSTFLKKVKPNVFDRYIQWLAEEGALSRHEEFLAPEGYTISLDGTYNKIKGQLLDVLKAAGYDFVKITEINFGGIPGETVDDILILLIDSGEIVKVAEGMYTVREYMDEAQDKIISRLKENGKITIAEIRDMFATSRKSAKPILEYMDSIKVTKKTGAESERISNL